MQSTRPQINFAKKVLLTYTHLTYYQKKLLPEEFQQLKKTTQQLLQPKIEFPELSPLELPSFELQPLELPSLELPPLEIPYVLTFKREYPLIEVNLEDYRTVLVSAKVTEEKYILKEPLLEQLDKEILSETKKLIDKKFRKHPTIVTNHRYLDKQIKKVCKKFNKTCFIDLLHKIKYYLLRDTIGFTEIEALLCDKNIEKIYFKPNEPVSILYKNPQIKIPTNIYLTNQEANSLINKLAKRSKQIVSTQHPILHSSLPDNTKIQATLGTEITEPRFTIIKPY